MFFAVAWNHALPLLNNNSPFGTYYGVVMVFNTWYVFPYFFNIFNVLINVIVSVLILGYAYNPGGLPRIPVWLFYVRLLSDCTGHSFESKMIEADFSQGNLAGVLGLVSMTVPILPSYLALYLMTFRNKIKSPVNALRGFK